MLEKPFIQIDREIITKIDNPTEAVILSYIVHEQASSFKNNNKIRKITNTEIAAKFGISKVTVSRNKTKLYEKNLLVEDSPTPNPRIGKLVWNENNESFDTDFIKSGRVCSYLTAIDETFHYFNYGFIKVDKEWFLNPDIDITTKYWTIFFKAFEKSDKWTPTWGGIERCCCWTKKGIRDAYYKLRDEGWVHNDKTIDINLDYQRLQGKSYNIDFIQEKVVKESIIEEVNEVLQSEKQTTKQLAEKAKKESIIEEVNEVLQSEKQTTIQLQEKIVKESIIEEKTSCEETNTDASTIEEVLDEVAKHLSNTQAYSIFGSDVRDRLQEMIEMKGKDYAINYMREHWPKIDLSKVL